MTDLLRRVPLMLLHCVAWFGLLGLVLPHPAVAGEGSDSTKDKPSAIAVFGGIVTDNNWEDTLVPWNLDYRESLVAGLAISHRIGRFDDRLSFEIEGQVVRHFGDQDHWEFNLPIVARWEGFPWDDVIDTSLAFGIGPSYASEIPTVEVANGGAVSGGLCIGWRKSKSARPTKTGAQYFDFTIVRAPLAWLPTRVAPMPW